MTQFLRSRFAIGAAATALACTLTTGSSGAATTSGSSGAPAPWTNYVALGDSFVSSPVTGLPVGRPVGCFRTQNNYPRQLAAVLNPSVFVDQSCGGATTVDFFRPQEVVGGPNMPQLDAVRPDTTLVTVGVGGNDVGLIGWAESCVHMNLATEDCVDQTMPGDNDPFIRRIARLAPRFDLVLETIHKRAPKAKVLVIGYPVVAPVAGAGCFPQLPIRDDDVAYLRDTQIMLNQLLQNLTLARGDTFVDTYSSSVDHDPCQMDGVKWIEGLAPDAPAASLHPNLRGQQAITAEILATLGYYG